jgi:hypothetical protein
MADLEFMNFKNYFNKLDHEIKVKKEQLQNAIKEARKVWRKN